MKINIRERWQKVSLCSQEGTNLSSRVIAKILGISQSSVQRHLTTQFRRQKYQILRVFCRLFFQLSKLTNSLLEMIFPRSFYRPLSTISKKRAIAPSRFRKKRSLIKPKINRELPESTLPPLQDAKTRLGEVVLSELAPEPLFLTNEPVLLGH
jgi:hypothetical protein